MQLFEKVVKRQSCNLERISHISMKPQTLKDPKTNTNLKGRALVLDFLKTASIYTAVTPGEQHKRSICAFSCKGILLTRTSDVTPAKEEPRKRLAVVTW